MKLVAPKMVIKRHLTWPLKLLLLVIIISLGGAMVLYAYHLGRNLTGFDDHTMKNQTMALDRQVKQLAAERDRFSRMTDAVQSQLVIKTELQNQLASQIRALESENVQLKEDLAFFRGLLPPNILDMQGIVIERLTANMVMPNQLHYQLLLIQGGQGKREFMGHLQLGVTLLQDGKKSIIYFPARDEANLSQYKLAFKYYQRVEGTLNLPEDVTVKIVAVRVLENGQLRVQRSVNL